MSKRSRGGSLTGGTGDVNPQWLITTQQPLTGGATYADTGTTLPRERLPYGGKSQVLELLKAQLVFTTNVLWNQTAATPVSARFYLTTASFVATEPGLTQQSGKVLVTRRFDFSGTAAGPAVDYQVIGTDAIVDLTDGAGHGLLVATDSMFSGFAETAAASPIAAAGSFAWRVLYRWKNVGLQEYIGIVQSQQ